MGPRFTTCLNLHRPHSKQYICMCIYIYRYIFTCPSIEKDQHTESCQRPFRHPVNHPGTECWDSPPQVLACRGSTWICSGPRQKRALDPESLWSRSSRTDVDIHMYICISVYRYVHILYMYIYIYIYTYVRCRGVMRSLDVFVDTCTCV